MSQQHQSAGRTVCAVIVSHDAGSGIVRVVDSLTPQVDHVVIVDNASDAGSREVLLELSGLHPGVMTLILNEENRWLARALNQGIEWADANNYDFVLLSSDTDLPCPGAVHAMLEVFFDPARGKVGSVNPRVLLEVQSADVPEHCNALEASGTCEIDLLVTGGCLVSMEAIRTVGPQREEFLIDMIDYDFGFRLQKSGYRTLEMSSVSMRYELGRTVSRRFLWRTCSVHNYSAIRRYYFARNGLTLVRESGNKPLSRFYWQFLFASIAKILLYESDKRRKLSFIGRGLQDSMKGRLGPYGSGLS